MPPFLSLLMGKVLIGLFFCLLSLASFSQDKKPELDWRVIELEWKFIKQQVGAPKDLPMPNIVVGPLPIGARMMFQFPINESDDYPLQIIIAPETLDTYSEEMIDWGVGHELTHYAFIMRDNNWDSTLKAYIQSKPHHCDPEFKSITNEIADVIFHVYHSQRERYSMWDQVQRSCWMQPKQ